MLPALLFKSSSNALHPPFIFLFFLNTRYGYLLEDQVYGTPHVDIHEVHVGVGVDELSTPRHGVHMATTHLHTKQIFRLVPLHESPLSQVTLGTQQEAGVT